ncbi:DUF1249 domain-containing protein [Hahella sp. SMD15-11]|uniref:DUF1249 domain-containing protein n=1 Tax=Thermohahella caldifontis TaxID=3142973 RepID=A0AB39UVC5_9GAMM
MKRIGHRYVPDLALMDALCEGNYHKLSRLIRDWDHCHEREIELVHRGQPLGRVALEVTEVCRYTNTVVARQTRATGPWLNNPDMVIRVYHDARSAEVVRVAGHGRLHGHRYYPNEAMHLPDEKAQMNRFLSDWLGFCLQHGLASGIKPSPIQ